jgi:hypothetical protein
VAPAPGAGRPAPRHTPGAGCSCCTAPGPGSGLGWPGPGSRERAWPGPGSLTSARATIAAGSMLAPGCSPASRKARAARPSSCRHDHQNEARMSMQMASRASSQGSPRRCSVPRVTWKYRDAQSSSASASRDADADSIAPVVRRKTSGDSNQGSALRSTSSPGCCHRPEARRLASSTGRTRPRACGDDSPGSLAVCMRSMLPSAPGKRAPDRELPAGWFGRRQRQKSVRWAARAWPWL